MAAHRLANLDALRGLAASAVLVEHVIGRILPLFPARQISFLRAATVDYFDWGRFGVVLFFLISGYVIPQSFRGVAPLKRFAVSRACRLYPAFWLSVLAMTGALLLSGWTISSFRVLANLTMVYNVFRQPALTGVYWTLVIELLFYCVAAALFFVGALENARVVAAVALASIASAVIPIALNHAGFTLPLALPGYHLSFLLLGSLIRQTHRRNPGAGACAWIVGIALAVTLPLVAGLVIDPGIQFSVARPVGAVLAIGAALIVFIASFERRFSAPAAVWVKLGAWSYSIYLFHEPLAELGIRYVTAAHPWTAIAFIVAVVVMTIAVSAAIYRLVEQPMIEAGRMLVRGWLPDRTAHGAA